MKFIILVLFIVTSINSKAKGDYGCVKKYNYEFCNLESDIVWQKLSKDDMDDIYKNFKIVDQNVKLKYGNYKYKNNKYSGHTIIYNSEESGKHIYILRLWFNDKSCETTVASPPLIWSDDSSIWCGEVRYSR